MNLTETIIKRILDLCKTNGITLNRLSIICGITQSTLNNIKNRRSNPTISTVKKICDGLEMTLAEFFDTKDFNKLEQEIV